MDTKLAVLCFTALLCQIASCAKYSRIGNRVIGGGRTYFLIRSNYPANFDIANITCNKLVKGSHLANVNNKAVYDKLAEEAAKSSAGVFILTGMIYNKSNNAIYYYNSKQKAGYGKWFLSKKPKKNGLVTLGSQGFTNGYYVVTRSTYF